MVEIVFKDYRFDTGLIIVFISGFILLVWILLKLFRVIETPLIFELMPLITGLAAIFGFGVMAGKALQIIVQTQQGLKETNVKLESLGNDHILLKSDFKHFVKYRKSLS
jgi:hypothetical protein